MPPENTSALTRRLIFGLLFGFIVMIALALAADLRQVSERMLTFRWSLYPWVMLLTLFNYLLRGYKFHFYLRQVGASEISLKESYHIFVAGFPLAVTPGKVGEVLKGVWIHHRTGVPTAKGLAVVVAERISDGLAVLLLSTLGVIAYPQYWPGFVAVLIILLGVIVISQIRPVALALLQFSKKLPFIKRFSPSLIDFYEGSFALFKPSATIIATGLGMFSWLGEGIGFYLILLGLGIPPSWETLSIAVFVLAFSTVIGAVSALPGGLGAAEASIAGMLTLILGLGTDTAAAATLLIRFATLWFSVLLGLIAWIFSRELLGLKPQIATGMLEVNNDKRG
ncbi:MAG: flippase-like domain-containing protein [Anaerolineales bacterium]|nr:flippase-like domain-containing protein [Chloroflexota bacterium]MBL6982977.1 flippase-like domain-containing protein [Anaerolineales bacterium]